jgi:transcriptional regulator with XRE-family HTH domain
VFANELRRLREVSGWSLSELADKTTYDRTYLSKLENGHKLGSIEAVAALDAAYGTGNHLQQLWRLAGDEVVPDRYRRYMQLEFDARVMQKYSISTIPGLLQTEGYARAQLLTARPRSEEALSEGVAARMARKAILDGDDPPHLRALLDESVLRRRTADPDIWREQLQALLDEKRPNVTIQVLPLGAGLHDLLGGSLTLLWLPGGKSVAYAESGVDGSLIEESTEVEQLKLSYDLLRDSALSPSESRAFIRHVMEDSTSCTPPVQS